MSNPFVKTHEPFSLTGLTEWDVILGTGLALPLGLPKLIGYDQTHCIVPIMNGLQSFMNAIYFYIYFAKHSLDSVQYNNESEFIFTDQEIYKNFVYIFIVTSH